MKNEVWKTIPGFSSYEVSNTGYVRSWRVSRRNSKVPHMMKTPKDNYGYTRVKLVSDSGQRIVKRVHELVMLSFVGKPNGLIVCHNDGNPENNNLDNLRYDTYKSNSLDMKKHGNCNFIDGENHPNAKLTSNDVLLARELHKNGFSYRKIAKRFNVSGPVIYYAVNKKTWKSV